MKMLFLVLFSFSLLAQDQPNPTPTPIPTELPPTRIENLNLQLYIRKDCKRPGMCYLSEILDLSNSEVVLERRFDMSLSSGGVIIGDIGKDEQPIPSEPQNSLVHYRGYWSLVKDVDDVRYMAVLTIDRYSMFNGESENAIYYQINAELLNNNGLLGEMSISVPNLMNLNRVRLRGSSFENNDYIYTPLFHIGPAIFLSPIPIPDDSDEKVQKNDWIVNAGSLE